MSDTEQSSPVLALLPEAEKTLSAMLGADARLEPGDALDGRANVLRCTVVCAAPDAPESVIVKSGHSRGMPYDPEDIDPRSGTMGFLKDWLGGQLLDAVPGGRGIGPRFYGGDRTHGFFIMEDLGAGGSLATILLADDPERAEEGLITFATALGRMHAVTAGKRDEYLRLAGAIGLSAEQIDAATGRPQLDSARFAGWCEKLEVTPIAGIDDEIEAVSAVLQEPGAFLAYTHGDPCPDNNRIGPQGLRLFDFEGGGFRHALLDGVYGRLPFPTCWCVNRLPEGIPARMENAYRRALAEGCPAASDDALFYLACLSAWAGWLVTTMSWSLDGAFEKDDEWGISSIRQRFVLRLGNFAARSAETGYLPALGRTMGGLAARLETLWSADTEPMPLYPAFRSVSE